jgi:hypothetical protein
MHRLSLSTALSIWSELDDAYYGKNGFGGHVAEIYVYKFLEPGPHDSMPERFQKEAIREANEVFYNLLAHYAKTRDASLQIQIGNRDQVRKLGPWLRKWPQNHRYHVVVLPRKFKGRKIQEAP